MGGGVREEDRKGLVRLQGITDYRSRNGQPTDPARVGCQVIEVHST